MHITYIAHAHIPSRTANSIQVMKMCQAFAQNGHRVVLIIPNKPPAEPNVRDVYEFYGVDRCFEVSQAPENVQLKRLPHIYSALAFLEAKRRRPDVVYGRVLAACCFSGLAGIPTIYEAHTPLNRARRSHRRLFSWLIHSKGLRRLVVISDTLKCHYQEQYGLPEARIFVAPDGADVPRPPDQPPFVNPARLQVGYIGHLYPGKGMEIVAALAEQCPWADFHVIGGLEADIKYWQTKTDDLQNLKFYGFIPPAMTDQYRQACDVLLAPYQRAVSGHGGQGDLSQWMSPLKIFEYMAAGKAIICSDLPVLREPLDPEKTALLCPPEAIQCWVAALRRLRDDIDLRDRLGRMAKQTFEANYTWQVRAANVIAGIEK